MKAIFDEYGDILLTPETEEETEYLADWLVRYNVGQTQVKAKVSNDRYLRAVEMAGGAVH